MHKTNVQTLFLAATFVIGLALVVYAEAPLPPSEPSTPRKRIPKTVIQVKKETSSQDCSMYPGTSAKWNNKTMQYDCHCSERELWSKKKNKCIKKTKRNVAKPDCSNQRNTKPLWNKKQLAYYCGCKPGYKLSASGNGCDYVPRPVKKGMTFEEKKRLTDSAGELIKTLNKLGL